MLKTMRQSFDWLAAATDGIQGIDTLINRR